ncbi:hypothetical protein HHL11_04385 [Ramlibacter sp. G-1-2-2]|uniref:TonB C-terminal domain-containing protein n=1 Tax=Ramlibacter agri TaxID=2728837 RepID=A0A848GXU5_9BURK|nr:hypothetical protein [Ramlibacter agri]NML42977.1 hypothetical protein [Ramlibacter agri]
MERRQGLWVASGLALLAHGVLLTQVQGGPAGPRGGPVQDFQVRWIAAPPLAAEAGPAEPAPAAMRPVAAPLAEPVPAIVAPAPAPLLQREARSAPPPPPAPAAREEGDALVPGEAPYLPRKLLTVAPVAPMDLDVPFPANVAGVVDLQVDVALFIDETGLVRRVQLESPDVPPEFVRAISETFVGARFKPGEVDRKPVRSRVKLQLEFHAPGRGAPAAGTLGTPAGLHSPGTANGPSS